MHLGCHKVVHFGAWKLRKVSRQAQQNFWGNSRACGWLTDFVLCKVFGEASFFWRCVLIVKDNLTFMHLGCHKVVHFGAWKLRKISRYAFGMSQGCALWGVEAQNSRQAQQPFLEAILGRVGRSCGWLIGLAKCKVLVRLLFFRLRVVCRPSSILRDLRSSSFCVRRVEMDGGFKAGAAETSHQRLAQQTCARKSFGRQIEEPRTFFWGVWPSLAGFFCAQSARMNFDIFESWGPNQWHVFLLDWCCLCKHQKNRTHLRVHSAF